MVSPLPVYTGPFGKEQAERLLWRAGFGARAGEAEKLSKLGLAEAVKSLTRPASVQLVGPEPHDSSGRPLAPNDAFGHDHLWWLDRMVRTSAPLTERMTLIWHSWFATSNQGVGSQKLMLDQNELFRQQCARLVRRPAASSVTADPAMLLWLNGNQNVKNKPNENYSRELMELFTLGANRGAYTETDVREQARALTGWRGSRQQGRDHAVHLPGELPRRRLEDDLRPDRQLHLAGGVQPLPEPQAASVVLRLEALELLRPDDARRGDRRRARGALRGPSDPAGRRGDPHAPGALHRARACSSRRWSSTPACCGCAGAGSTRTTWSSLGKSAGQQLFYPPDVGGWDYTRWLDTATFRARWFIAALVQGAGEPKTSPSDPAELVQRSLQFWGFPTITPQTEKLLTAFAKAQLARKNAAPVVETAIRRLIASSPDLQTA